MTKKVTSAQVKKASGVSKSSKATQQRSDKQMRVTVYFGYGLFLLTVGFLAANTLSWFNLYTDQPLRNFSVTALLVTFVFTATAPLLVGYLAGDSATRAKSKLVHHYNGVLFGIVGIWLWLAMSSLGNIAYLTVATRSIFEARLYDIAPAALAAIFTVILAIFYVRSAKRQVPVIDYAPYLWAIISSVIVALLGLAAAALINGFWYGDNIWMGVLTILVMPLLPLLVATLIGYWILGNRSGSARERITKSLVAAGMGIITTLVAAAATNHVVVWQVGVAWIVFPLIVAVWLAYLILLRWAAK